MKTIFSLILFASLSAVAQTGAPSGSFTIPINSSVYDVSGTHYGDDEDAEVVFYVTHLANGVLSGSATVEYDDGFLVLEGTGPLIGRVTGNSTAQTGRFRFSAPVSGYDLDNLYYTGNYTWTGSGRHDINSGALFLGSGSAAGCVRGYGCRRNPVSIVVDAGSGEWHLELELTTALDGKTVTGTAQAVHANGRTFDYTVKGRYSVRTDKSTLTLTGTDENPGTKLVVAAVGNFNVTRVTGKLLGQAVKHEP